VTKILVTSVKPFVPSFIHLAVCLTTGPKPLTRLALYIVRSRFTSTALIKEYLFSADALKSVNLTNERNPVRCR
jgi:hypothetical protein